MNHFTNVSPRFLLLAALLYTWTLAAQPAAAGSPVPVMRTVLRLVGVVAGAKSAEQTIQGLHEYWKGSVAPGESVYSVTAQLNRGSWADLFSRPDVFLVLEYEGGRQVVVADIAHNWDYGARVFTFRCPTMPPGRQCAVRLCDDDGALDAALKTLATRELRWEVAGYRELPDLSSSMCGSLELTVTAGGELMLIDPELVQGICLNAPDVVALATFTVPDANAADRWQMAGRFSSGSTDMGEVRLTHWHTNSLPMLTTYLMRPRTFFWGMLVLGAMWVSLSIKRSPSGPVTNGPSVRESARPGS